MHWKSSRRSLLIQRTLKQQKCCPLQSGRSGLGNVQSKECSRKEDSFPEFLLVIPSIYHSCLIHYHMIGLYTHLSNFFLKKVQMLFSSSAALWPFISINCTNLSTGWLARTYRKMQHNLSEWHIRGGVDRNWIIFSCLNFLNNSAQYFFPYNSYELVTCSGRQLRNWPLPLIAILVQVSS